MTGGVCIFQRIVSDVTVAIQSLRIPGLRHHRIRAHKPPQRRVIIPRAIIHQPRARIASLPREPVIRRYTPRRAADISKRVIRLRAHARAARRARRTQMVAVQIHHARAGSHRDALFAEIVIFQRVPVRDFIVIAYIKRRNAVRGFLDAVSISIVDIRRRVRTDGDARQFVFLVIDQRVANCQAK